MSPTWIKSNKNWYDTEKGFKQPDHLTDDQSSSMSTTIRSTSRKNVGGKERNYFSDLFTRFSAFKYIWYCYKFRPAHFGLIKIYIGSWNRYLGSSILVSSFNMCFGSRVFGSWQLRQFWVQLVYLSLADLRQISTDLLHSFLYVRARWFWTLLSLQNILFCEGTGCILFRRCLECWNIGNNV